MIKLLIHFCREHGLDGKENVTKIPSILCVRDGVRAIVTRFYIYVASCNTSVVLMLFLTIPVSDIHLNISRSVYADVPLSLTIYPIITEFEAKGELALFGLYCMKIIFFSRMITGEVVIMC